MGSPVVEKICASRRMHAFYYLWYGNEHLDQAYKHWDHRVLPHWNLALRDNFPHSILHDPPNTIGAPFFPLRGLYSSLDQAVMQAHADELCREAGVGVLVAGWTGQPDNAHAVDGEGVNTDAALRLLATTLAARNQASASVLDVRLAVHIEPYVGRTAESVAADAAYLNAHVLTAANAFSIDGRHVFYVYDSYRTQASEWAHVLKPAGAASVRGAAGDGFFFGLCLDRGCVAELSQAGFDGLYTYFGSDGLSYGSTSAEWAELVRQAHRAGLVVSLSVGPGYDDTRIRPWNSATRKPRDDGAYYRRMLQAAIAAAPDYISVTSFNEWGEGTQIEPAVARTCPQPQAAAAAGLECTSLDYGDDPLLYLRITAQAGAAFCARDAATGESDVATDEGEL